MKRALFADTTTAFTFSSVKEVDPIVKRLHSDQDSALENVEPFGIFPDGRSRQLNWDACTQLRAVALDGTTALTSTVQLHDPAQSSFKNKDSILDYIETWGIPRWQCVPAIDASLHSIVWPTSPEVFLSNVRSRNRALVTHCSAIHRLSELCDMFKGFDLPSLLEDSLKVVVWMKDLVTGQMQYVQLHDISLAMAYYKAGHSLYFNPRNQQLLEPIARELGIRGSELGDVEMFAVSKEHVTPWHFDAQEGITIQLKGCKTWTIAPSSLLDPLTNLHPQTSNMQSLHDDLATHFQSCGADLFNGVSPHSKLSEMKTFTLRPGSVMYIPAGMWHMVTCDSESLSLNLSIDGNRWADLLMSKLSSIVYSLPLARKRYEAHDIAQSRSIMGTLLKQVSTSIDELRDGELASPASLEACNSSYCVLDLRDDDSVHVALDDSVDILLSHSYQRSSLISVVQCRDNPAQWIISSPNTLSSGSFSVFLTMHVSPEMNCAISRIQSSLSVTADVLVSMIPTSQKPELFRLLQVCIFYGLLV